jgi:tetratricopeptide (TPR) repeat protein
MIRHAVLASCACAAIVASPAIIAAQRGATPSPSSSGRVEWVEGLSELTAAVAGTYGDEGARIGPALDKMARGLAEWDRAIQMFESRLNSEAPGAPTRAAAQMHTTLSGMYEERGRLADAVRELAAASRLEPQRADLHVRRGIVLDASARSADAGEAFRTARALDASDPITAYHVVRHSTTIDIQDVQGARDTLAAAYLRLLQDRARAKASPFAGIDLLQDSAPDTPVLAPATYARGYARIAHGEYEEAIAEFRKAAAIDPLVTDPAARSTSLMPAASAFRQGRLAEARSLLEGSTAPQESSEAHRVLGLIYWADAQDDKSIEQLEIAIRANSQDERSRLALSRVLSSAGRDEEAERVLQETIRVLTDSALARWWLGSGYQRLNQLADARREFELVVGRMVAGQGGVFAMIGQLAGNAADVPAAVNAFAHAVGARPNDPEVRKYLAGALLQQDRPDEAFVELVAALLIDPLDAGAHAGIGQIHLNAGRYDAAVTALRRAVELSADHAEARYALATALMRLGNTQEATRELERFEQAQRRLLADRRRSMALDVVKEEAALRTAEGNFDTAIALYEKASTLGTDPGVYRQLAELYAKVGRIEDAMRARAMYDRALQGNVTSRSAPR